MKKFISLILSTVFMFGVVGCNSAPGKLVVGLDENFPPMGFRDEKGELVGFDIDMAKEAGKRMGYEMEFQPISWSSKELELSSKRVDLLWNGLTITDARRETILFTKPYLKNKQVIMVRSDSGIASKADLAGKIVGLQKDSSAEDAVTAYEEATPSLGGIVTYEDNLMAFTDLDIQRTNAVVVDEVVAKYYLSKNQTNLMLLEDNFGDEEYGVGMRLDEKDLLNKLQKALDDMNSDGTSAEISKRWFGEDIVIK